MIINKVIRFTLPFIIAYLILGIMFIISGLSKPMLVSDNGEAKWSTGIPLNERSTRTQSMMIVNPVEDEHSNDGDCSLREGIAAASDNVSVDACQAGEEGSTDRIAFSVSGMIILNNNLQ
jgi:CSLREA domain-containing protein